MLSTILNAGISEQNSEEINTKIKIANNITLIAIIAATLYGILFSFFVREGVIAIAVTVGIFIFSNFLIGINLHAIGRLTLFIGIISGITSTFSILINVQDTLPWAYPFLFCCFLILPFLLFSSKEVFFQWISIIVATIFSFLYPVLPEFIVVNDFDNSFFLSNTYATMIQITGVLLTTTFLYVYNTLINNSVAENEKLKNEILIQQENLIKKEIETVKLLEEVQIQRNEEEKRNWQNIGINELMLLARNTNDMNLLYDLMINHIINYSKANQGGVYVHNEIQNILELKAIYAYDKKRFLNQEINIKETLVGQCFMEKEYIYIKDVPQNYVTITSGLGEATASTVIILPLNQQEKVIGVLELAYFKQLEEYEIDFLKKVAENMGSIIGNIKTNENIKVLLKQAEEQSITLKMKEESLRQNIVEMLATQEELLRKEEEYRRMIADLQEQLVEKV